MQWGGGQLERTATRPLPAVTQDWEGVPKGRQLWNPGLRVRIPGLSIPAPGVAWGKALPPPHPCPGLGTCGTTCGTRWVEPDICGLQ